MSIVHQIKNGAKLAPNPIINFFPDRIEITSDTAPGKFTINIRTTEDIQEYKLIKSQVRSILRVRLNHYKGCFIATDYDKMVEMSY